LADWFSAMMPSPAAVQGLARVGKGWQGWVTCQAFEMHLLVQRNDAFACSSVKGAAGIDQIIECRGWSNCSLIVGSPDRSVQDHLQQ
jgi:hypothetical protein